MNIEAEVKSILRMEIQLTKKVELIQDFTNFHQEDIEESIKRKYGYKADVIYGELLSLDQRRKHGKMR